MDRILAVLAVTLLAPGAFTQRYSTTQAPVVTTGCICTLEFNPVCGADGTTYGNACSARCAGATVAFNGTCTTTTQDSVSTRPSGSTTASSGCICTALFSPVCGADGKTYSNACQAGCAGVRVVSNQACATTTMTTPTGSYSG